MAGARAAPPTAGRVCQVCHGTGAGQVHGAPRLRHPPLARLSLHTGLHHGAHALHRHAARDRVGPGLPLLLPHALSRRHDRLGALHRRGHGNLFRSRHTLRCRQPLRHAHLCGPVLRAAAHTGVHLAHDGHVLPPVGRGPARPRHLPRRHAGSPALLRLRHTVRPLLGAIRSVRPAHALHPLDVDARTRAQPALDSSLLRGLHGLLRHGRLCAQQHPRAAPAHPHQRALRPRGRHQGRRLQCSPE